MPANAGAVMSAVGAADSPDTTLAHHSAMAQARPLRWRLHPSIASLIAGLVVHHLCRKAFRRKDVDVGQECMAMVAPLVSHAEQDYGNIPLIDRKATPGP